MKEIKKGTSIIIFGASGGGLEAYEELRQEHRVIAFSDNDSRKWGDKLLGIEVISPNCIVEYIGDDTVVLIASQHHFSIFHQLCSLGIQDIYIWNRMAYKGRVEYSIVQCNRFPLFQNCEYRSIPFQIDNSVSTQKKNPRNVLIVAYYFPPSAGGGVQRALKFANYLDRFNYHVTVLTVGNGFATPAWDESQLNDIRPGVKIIRVDDPAPISEAISEHLQQEICDLLNEIVGDKSWFEGMVDLFRSRFNDCSGLIPDQHIAWAVECLRNIAELIDLDTLATVITTGNPFSDFLIGYGLKRRFGIKWIMDYRDPWSTNSFYNERLWKYTPVEVSLHRKLEECLVNEADRVVSVWDGRNDYGKICGVPKEKLVLITNGFDEEDFSGIEMVAEDDKFRIIYNGSLYYTRNPVTVVQAVNELINEERVDKNSIEISFVGYVEQRIRECLEREDPYHVLTFSGYVNHKDSLRIAAKATVLLLLGETGDGGKIVIPGKTFEYIRLFRPILCLTEPGGLLNQFMDKTRTGNSVQYYDVDGIKNILSHWYRLWKGGQSIYLGDREVILSYSRENKARELAKIIDELNEDKVESGI